LLVNNLGYKEKHMPEKKLFKYYAIRVLNTVVIRRTVGPINLVRSRLYTPTNGKVIIEQTTYTGGKVIGTISYAAWTAHGGKAFLKGVRITREQFRAFRPFLQKGE
jgi:hypothetical protein